MKKALISAALALLALTGCAGVDIAALADPLVRVAEAATDENTSTAKGATAGMSSSDAANVLMTRDYYSALKAVHGAGKGAERAPLVEIEARDGKPITIDAKSFRVYAPPAQGAQGIAIAQPKEVESAGIKWFREIRRGLAEVFLPWRAVERGADTAQLRITTDAAVRQTELGVINNAVTGSQDLAGQVIETYTPADAAAP